jgi:hypothetical protein
MDSMANQFASLFEGATFQEYSRDFIKMSMFPIIYPPKGFNLVTASPLELKIREFTRGATVWIGHMTGGDEYLPVFFYSRKGKRNIRLRNRLRYLKCNLS